MNISDWLFTGFFILCSISCFALVWLKNVLPAALALVVVFSCAAVFMVLAGAPLLGLFQMIVYIGGIMVLVLFGTLYVKEPIRFIKEKVFDLNRLVQLCLVGLITWLVYAFQLKVWEYMQAQRSFSKPTVMKAQDLGLLLFSKHSIAFEWAGVLLLIATLAALWISGKGTQARKELKR
jgi:NADH:ubiquinone oxidoreductase subunit 6 (subunit J)